MRAALTLVAAMGVALMGAGTAHAQGEAPTLPPGHPPTPTQAPSPAEAPAAAPAGEPAAVPPSSAPSPAGAPGAAPSAEGHAGGPPPSAEGLPPGHPPTGGGGAGPTPGGSGRVPRVLQPPSLASARESDEVPAGSIRVTVVDAAGRPIPDAAVDVGVLAQGDRSRHNGRTDASGVAVFSDLPTGSGQAYRVNVPHAGAKYSSTPFQLPPTRGYDVRITRLAVTRESRFVFFHVFRVIIEQRGERIHVIHQTELTNAGEETFVFPAQGQRVELPENSLNFQFQRVMTDQRVEEVSGDDEHAYLLRGSLPPGTVRLAWAYDLELDGEDLTIPVELPLPFFGLQVIAEALPELELSVQGMPTAQRLAQDGSPCEDSLRTPNCAWVTQLRRGPEESRLDRIVIQISGIPGPSPVRWIAVAIAVLFILGGVFVAASRRDTTAGDADWRARRRRELLAQASELEAEFEAGEIGPEFRQKRRDAIVRELAVLLHQDDAVGEEPPAR